MFIGVYNIRFVPHSRLCHRILQILYYLLVIVLSDCNVPFWVLPVVVATCQVNDAKCAVGIVMGYNASLLESCHRAVEVCWSGGYHLQHAPGVFLSREERLPLLLTEQEGMNCS